MSARARSQGQDSRELIEQTPTLATGSTTPGVVSVVIPCYNYARYLADCVSSALDHQGQTQVEVVIVDDCSTDHTQEVGTRLAERDSRVRYVRHEQNLGHIATYNDGLSRVTGEFVALVSADDLVAPGALDRARAVLSSDPGLAFAFGPVAHTTEQASGLDPTAWADQDAPFSVVTSDGHSWSAHVTRNARNPVACPEVVCRTAAQWEVGGYRPDLPHSGDLEMWLRLTTVGGVATISGPYQAIRRMHTNNMSSGYTAASDLEQVEAAFAVFQAYARRAWPADPDLLPGVRATLARRAIRLGLDEATADGDFLASDEFRELLAYALSADPSVRARPSTRLLMGLAEGRTWASAALPIQRAGVSMARGLAGRLRQRRGVEANLSR